MRKPIFFILIFLIKINLCTAQSTTITCQFFDDANNNCIHDNGEQLVYSTNTQFQLVYLNNNSSTTSVNYGPTTICQNPTFAITNYAQPASNTIIVNGLPQIIYNQNCGLVNCVAYTNTIQFIPLKKASGISQVNLVSGSINYYGANSSTTSQIYDTFPVCSNLGNDTINFNFYFRNLLTCQIFGGTSLRTYSLFLDGSLYDVVSFSGVLPIINNNVPGMNNMCKASENIYNTTTILNFTTKLPIGISTLGSHLFAIKSSSLYTNPLSVIEYTCKLNSLPCTKISGMFFDDCNGNCIKDLNENGSGVGVQGNILGSNGMNTIFNPNSNGKFSLFLPSNSSYSLSHHPIYSTFTACSNSTITIPPSVSTNTLLIGYKSNSNFHNTSHYVHAWRNGLSMPGTLIRISYLNISQDASVCGNSLSPVSGTQKIILDPNLKYWSTTNGPAPSTIIPSPSGDTIVWNTSDLNTLALGYFSVNITPTVSTLTPFKINGSIYPVHDDFIPDNFCSSTGAVGAPFDPNLKELFTSGLQSNGDIIYKNGQELQYTIHFQNVGTAPAINVKTLDTIDVNLDLKSIKLLGSSSPVCMQIDSASRQVSFLFDNINLASATVNEFASHGFVRYSIKLNSNVPVNTIIRNKGFNYFDFNEPVPTNQTKNKLILGTDIKENSSMVLKGDMILYPVPAKDTLNIILINNNIPFTYEIFSAFGQKIDEGKFLSKSNIEIINTTSISNGIYILKTQTKLGVIIKKFIIER